MYVLGMDYPSVYIEITSDFKHEDKIHAFNYDQFNLVHQNDLSLSKISKAILLKCCQQMQGNMLHY